MSVLEYYEFKPSLVKLRKRGGPYQRAAERAIVMMEDLRGGRDELSKLPVTNHGESRIPKAVKYDLTGSCRLVTIQDGGHVFLCFIGTHDETDKWLDRNRGLTIQVDKDCRPVATFQSIDVANPEQRLERDMGQTSQLLLSLVDERLREGLLGGLHWKTAGSLASAEVSIGDDDIEQLTNGIESQDHRSAVFDTLILLRSDDVEGARRRIQAFLGDLVPLTDGKNQEEVLVNSSDFQNIDIDSEHYRKLIEHFARSADFKDWMLFMHPDQHQYVAADYAGSAKLSGVSGSGKTCVVVKRALSLAARYPGEKVLVLTLNRSLAGLINGLVDSAALPEVRDRIDVLPFFTVCQSLLSELEPENDRLYDDVTWKSREHIDAVWREFYRCELNNYDARILQRLHDSLIARGIDAEHYIREEFDWIRSATTPESRDAYLRMERAGRTYPLDESFRKELLQGLEHWEQKMLFVGVTDYLGVANALSRHVERLKPCYRCIILDESQDFGTIDIRIVRKLVSESDNDIFLCGDAAQQVSSKHQNLAMAGVAVPGARSHKLTLNYRNSREILELAHGVLVDNISEQMLDSKDFDVLDPRYANFSGPSPLLLHADEFRGELFAALEYARNEADSNPAAKIGVALCGYSAHEVAAFAKVIGMPTLDGETSLESGQVFLSDLENTKGFEFQTIIVVNCSSNVLPNPCAPSEETFRDLSRLYVAMTRARHQLVVSFNGDSASAFFAGQLSSFTVDEWASYIGDYEIPEYFSVPERLEQLRSDAGAPDLGEMNGEQYLYTEGALGCSPVLIEKLRSLVTGRSTTRGGAAAEWKDLKSAVRDTGIHVKSRQVFGPEGFRLFRERFGGAPSEAQTKS